ncbi:MAG TPA: hypothetical protein VMU51_11165 [Mycobacteriales bacterium]|nr:hypothetical protein [Mycobacteriales bacterium]
MNGLPRSSVIAAATVGSVLVSFLLSVAWLASMTGVARLEPATQALGLLGGLAGVMAERRVAARERRASALRAVAYELRDNVAVLNGPQFTPDPRRSRPTVYRRLTLSAVDAAVVSGALADRGDAELVRRLHEWRDLAAGFNRRLEITEVCTFMTTRPAEIAEFAWALSRPDGYLAEIGERLRELRAFLTVHHPAAAASDAVPAAASAAGRPAGSPTDAGQAAGSRPVPVAGRPAGPATAAGWGAAAALVWLRTPRWSRVSRRLVRRAAGRG